MNDPKDLAYLEMAYGLAQKARGRTSPNPCVGAVIVKDGRIAGFGYHEEAGKPHAEIVALARAGRRAKGATIYLTLEPCVHWGRTPPCVDSLIRAGLKRAVISAVDPNPLMNGRGIIALKRAGIEVSSGRLGEKNKELNRAYLKFITRRVPFVTLKVAASLDGRIAAKTGHSRWISSAPSRESIHLLRGEHDAILIGIGTVLRDDPRLTVRHPLWPGKRILRIILDTRLRTPRDARILSSPSQGDVSIFTGPQPPERKAGALESTGAAVIRVPLAATGVDLEAVLAELGRRDVTSLLVEGGSRIFTAFIEGRLADKLVLTLSPKLIGGTTALSFLEGEGPASIKDSLRVKNIRSFPIGDDRVIEGYF